MAKSLFLHKVVLDVWQHPPRMRCTRVKLISTRVRSTDGESFPTADRRGRCQLAANVHKVSAEASLREYLGTRRAYVRISRSSVSRDPMEQRNHKHERTGTDMHTR